ncbi:hypothetical protein H5410_033174 [Solanum commersonii]|uniref:Uncharacterized protein n=1 Tax=Solanum commersonii TaxID=4109 RepID=A0A9J5YRT5_SOLCO|nr:hypothetical protein H5410_033174 [Solanum commersonii]
MDIALPNSWATAMQSLTQLRYLALHVRQFKLEWISHLHNLQTLQLKSSKRIRLRAATLWEMKKLRRVNIDSFPVVWEDNDEKSFEECSTSMLENMKTFRTCNIRLDNMNARLWWKFPNLEEVGLQVEDEPKFPLFPIPEIHTRLHSVSLKFSLMKVFNSVGWERLWWKFPNLEEVGLQVEDEPKFPLFPIPEIHTRLHSVSLKFSLMKVFNSVGWERYFVFPSNQWRRQKFYQGGVGWTHSTSATASNIRHLYLAGFFLMEEMVLNIARLKKLESLKLNVGFPFMRLQSFRKGSWDVTNVEFPCTKILDITLYDDE